MSLDGQYDDQNIFAKIIQGELPCVKVFENDDIIAFMDIFPQSRGHTLVVPKEPARNLLDLSQEAAQNAIPHVQHVARAVNKALKPDGIIVTQFNGAPAGQSVFHIHFHIIPKWEDQALGSHADSGQADPETLEPLAEMIRAAL